MGKINFSFTEVNARLSSFLTCGDIGNNGVVDIKSYASTLAVGNPEENRALETK